MKEIILLALASNQFPIDDVLYRDSRGRRGVTLDLDHVDHRWANCTVPYFLVTVENCHSASQHYSNACDNAFSDSSILETARQSIETAAANVYDSTSPVHCSFSEESLPTENMLFVTNKPDSCHVHHVGFSAVRPNVMSLGWCVDDLPSVMHELLHVLGLDHEHQSPASEPYLDRCEQSVCKPNYFNCKIMPDAVYYATEMDFRSLMLYPLGYKTACDLSLTQAGSALAYAQGIEDHSTIGRFSSISQGDSELVVSLYTGTSQSPRTCAGHNNKVRGCVGSGYENGCVTVHWIGDGECDPATQCYDNDGGDCLETPTSPPTEPSRQSKKSSSSSSNNTLKIVLGVVAGMVLVGLVAIALRGHSHSGYSSLPTSLPEEVVKVRF